MQLDSFNEISTKPCSEVGLYQASKLRSSLKQSQYSEDSSHLANTEIPQTCGSWNLTTELWNIYIKFVDRPEGPTQPPVPWESGLFPGAKPVGAWRWTLAPFSAEVKERIELYLYSPSGSSWPVVGWTLPLGIFVT